DHPRRRRRRIRRRKGRCRADAGNGRDLDVPCPDVGARDYLRVGTRGDQRDDRDRRGKHPTLRSSCPRLHAVGAGDGRRDGGTRPWRVQSRYRVSLHPPQHRGADHRPGQPLVRRRDHYRGIPQFPGGRRPTAEAELGTRSSDRIPVHVDQPGTGLLPGIGHLRHGALPQLPRRRHPHRPRSAALATRRRV
ncbi:MAG: ABC transporter, permease protein 2 (cluster 5, nickel/peptides/opines), partial [uncultured Thermomicrobiales bacterium]